MTEPFEDCMGTARWQLMCAITDLSTTAADALREFVVSDGGAAMRGLIPDLRSCVARIEALAGEVA